MSLTLTIACAGLYPRFKRKILWERFLVSLPVGAVGASAFSPNCNPVFVKAVFFGMSTDKAYGSLYVCKGGGKNCLGRLPITKSDISSVSISVKNEIR